MDFSRSAEYVREESNLSSASTSLPSNSATLPRIVDVSKARILGAALKGIIVDKGRKRIIYCSLFALKDLCSDSAANLNSITMRRPDELK
jgi:hypothetical protein